MLTTRLATLLAGAGVVGLLAVSPLVAQGIAPFTAEPVALRSDGTWSQLRITRRDGSQVTVSRDDIARVEYLTPARAATGGLPGTYSWVGGQTLVIQPDGTCQVFLGGRQINSCAWISLGDGRYRFTHRDGGWVDTVTLSPDGNVITGRNNVGSDLRGQRIGVQPQPVDPPPAPGLPGRYNWVSGQVLVIQPNGTCQVFLNGQQINSCAWVSLGGDRYRLTHRDGGWVDTITLSADGKVISGVNNAGNPLRGVRQ